MSFYQELKRRNVIRVGIAYTVIAWLLLQLTEVLKELLSLPDELGRMVVVILAIGFIPTMIFAWVFEMTPEGLRKDSDVDRSDSIAPHTGRKLDRVIIGLLVLGLAYFIWESRFQEDSGQTPSVEQRASSVELADDSSPATDRAVASIVVLPFVNMSADEDQEYFSDGLSEEILNALVPIEDLRVISRTSAFAFKDKDLSVPEIAAQLGVSHVLEGSVRTSGDNLRITAQLIEVETDSHLWSEAYNRTMENVFEVQEEISLAIAEQLQLRLSDSVQTAAQTENIEAYTLFLQGRHFYQQRGTEELERAEGLLKQAVALDPEFHEAWSTLAATLIVKSYVLPERYFEYQEEARVAANRALDINPENGFALAVLGLLAFQNLDFEEALIQLDQALVFSPNESNAYLWKAIVLASLGYTRDAIAVLKKAEKFDPAFHNLHNWMSDFYVNLGDYETARHHEAMAVAIQPSGWTNRPGLPYLLSGDLEAYNERVNRITAVEMTEENRELLLAFGTAYIYPEKRDETVKRLVAGGAEFSNLWGGWMFMLELGALDEAMVARQAMEDALLGLHLVNSYGGLWKPPLREQISGPEWLEIFKSDGMFNYWKKHGAPDFCQLVGETLECTE